ncbi:hypothetical protein [Caballeronia sp. ATUFL_M2_KS44]|uniref:hypothetical protein n=1 Tax=Caballeronia sp. ATUFL_M2_KS44 TaxID=2921767 RepID=UPI00202809CB|nr:hypothetical protein [Caballeronia sp. ATUFL_M2_KS44]
MQNTDPNNIPSNDAAPVAPWTQLIVDTTVQYPLFDFSDFDHTHIRVTTNTVAQASAAFDVDEDRRLRVEAWAQASNKSRSSRRHSKDAKGRKEWDKTLTQALTPNLPSRPNLRKLVPLQYWVGGASRRPPFVAWLCRDDGTTKHVVIELTEEEFAYMDEQLAGHIREPFRQVTAERSLNSISESDLTAGHWMADWWFQLHYDLPLSCSVLMDCLDSCHPPRAQRAR